VSSPWTALEQEIGRWRDDGRVVEFWLRDDDASRLQPALERLFDVTLRWRIPLALAVVPHLAEPALFAALPSHADVLQHGFDHVNRAREGEKKSEYPPGEALATAQERLCAGRDQLRKLAAERSLEVLAPPWNRIALDLAIRLPEWGFRGLSRFGPRAAQRLPGLREINTHVDLIAWKGDRGFAGAAPALGQAVKHLAARRHAGVPDEPTGWLTHHARHDTATWDFLEELFARTQDAAGVRWRSARDLFAAADGLRASR
jgi:hypothetical protein